VGSRGGQVFLSKIIKNGRGGGGLVADQRFGIRRENGKKAITGWRGTTGKRLAESDKEERTVGRENKEGAKIKPEGWETITREHLVLLESGRAWWGER